MAGTVINLNDTTPAAPAGRENVKWQADLSNPRNVSANVKSLPLTTAGDLLYEDASPTPVRLPIGTSGQRLRVVAGLPAWADTDHVSVNSQALGYTAVLGDDGNVVKMTDASATTFTVPPNSSVAFVIGATLTIIQYGAGQITLTPGSGVTLRTASSLTTRVQYSTVALVKVGTDEWIAGGDLT